VCVESCPTLKARKLAAFRRDASGVAHSRPPEWFGHGESNGADESARATPDASLRIAASLRGLSVGQDSTHTWIGEHLDPDAQ